MKGTYNPAVDLKRTSLVKLQNLATVRALQISQEEKITLRP